MNKNPFGRTIRQEVINHAVLKLCIWRRQGQMVKIEEAIESVIDGGRPGTLGGMMKDYVASISDLSFRRMECEIERKAK